MLEGFLLGISMGGYCTTTCAPFLLPYLVISDSSRHLLLRKILVLTQFLLGRLLAYCLFAVVAIFLGKSLSNYLTPAINSLLLMTASLLMIASALGVSGGHFSLCRLLEKYNLSRLAPLLTGFILGLNLCPPFLVATTRALTMGSFSQALLLFIFLFLGSSIYFLPLPFLIAFINNDSTKRIGIYLGFLVGIWFLIQGIMGLL